MFFFCKQKTAYEMRISDWSSDVCSSDLQQEQADGGWKGRLEPLYLLSKRESPAVEAELIEHDLKWSPVKVLAKTFPQGVGPSSNWRLFVDYLPRAGEVMPEEGVPFTAIVKIGRASCREGVCQYV